MSGFETFVRDLAHLREGRKTIVTLRSLAPGRAKYLAQNVVAVVARQPGPDGEWRPLVVRSAVGHRYPDTWYVRIVETLPSLAPGAPYDDAYEANWRAWSHRLRK